MRGERGKRELGDRDEVRVGKGGPEKGDGRERTNSTTIKSDC